MFTYFHCYHPETWQAQLDCGLIDEHAGIRFAQSLLCGEDLKFNRLAARDGDFWRLQSSLRLPMYIDRLQGGCYFEGYAYDEALLDAYRALLGDGFLGFQMHEWMSNLQSDLLKLQKHHCPAWTEEAITETILRAYPYPHLFLEAMSAGELAAAGRPDSAGAFLAMSEALFRKRMEQRRGQLIPCDSGALAYQLEISAGARLLMAEIGAQTRDTRVQIAYARGMARAHRLRFGAYYEPWGGAPFSACCYHREGRNEWGIERGCDFPFEACGENGGSSRSMQRRLQLYAYFAGAGFFSEEWGLCNTFYDWQDFELTPYGEVKRDFLNLIKKYPDPGRIYTPIALVLSRDVPVLAELHSDADTLFGYPLDGAAAARYRSARRGIRSLLSSPVPMTGPETASLINSEIPDAFDILHDDTPAAFDGYDCLVDLTGGSLKTTHRRCTVEEAPALLEQLMPCSVEGGVHWFVNRTSDGWLLIILNNDGIRRSVADGETALAAGNRDVTVRIKNGAVLRRLEGDADLRTEGDVCRLALPAGGWFLGAF